MKKRQSHSDLILKYLFVFLFISFVGRFYEFFLVLGEGTFNYVKYFPTSVYTLIFAFPYGVGVILLYLTIRALNKYKFIKNNFLLKLIIAVVLIDVAELVTGLIALKTLGIMPWNYSGHILNFKGLISMPTTIRWTIVLMLFGKFAYRKIDNFIKRPLSDKIKKLTIATLILYVIYLAIIIGLNL
jgi:uncharacterized membrane protein